MFRTLVGWIDGLPIHLGVLFCTDGVWVGHGSQYVQIHVSKVRLVFEYVAFLASRWHFHNGNETGSILGVQVHYSMAAY